jgi:predicted nucleic acid-binding protein
MFYLGSNQHCRCRCLSEIIYRVSTRKITIQLYIPKLIINTQKETEKMKNTNENVEDEVLERERG